MLQLSYVFSFFHGKIEAKRTSCINQGYVLVIMVCNGRLISFVHDYDQWNGYDYLCIAYLTLISLIMYCLLLQFWYCCILYFSILYTPSNARTYVQFISGNNTTKRAYGITISLPVHQWSYCPICSQTETNNTDQNTTINKTTIKRQKKMNPIKRNEMRGRRNKGWIKSSTLIASGNEMKREEGGKS